MMLLIRKRREEMPHRKKATRFGRRWGMIRLKKGKTVRKMVGAALEFSSIKKTFKNLFREQKTTKQS